MVENDKNKLLLKTINELLGYKFYIPAYQRGYRWASIQVKELLDDIWEYTQSGDANKASFYCLQPIVVAERNIEGEQHWEVVDGQQRLTTIYVILHYLEKEHLRRDLVEAYKKPIFEIEYETRKESKRFLEDIQNTPGNENIDYFHISNAYNEVSGWFDNLDFSDTNAFIGTLLGKPGDPNSVQVIWYDLTDECKGSDYAVDVFSRINIGKIPLTNAELIKALFLQNSHAGETSPSLKQIQIASEWDAIEKSLQDPSFWYFIYNTASFHKYDTRIEYVFDLMKSKPAGAEKFFTFHRFHDTFRASKNGGMRGNDQLWKEVKDYFLTFDEWYRDRVLYHLIGFLVACGKSVVELKSKSESPDMTKTKFKSYLGEEVRKQVKCQLDSLAYSADTSLLRKVLLLFNIQTLLATREADIRFPFDRYKQEEWDIEHIRSQTDKEIVGAARQDWLQDILEYFTNTKDPDSVDIDNLLEEEKIYVKKACELLRSAAIDEQAFQKYYDQISILFKEGEAENIDGIGNLTLLDATTNRSYKNAMFPVKRKRIIRNDMNGIFVPICTKNVFLKFYSKKFGNVMYWNNEDAEEYVKAIKEVLNDYLPDQVVAHG